MRLDDNFSTVTLTYGFMESPDVPRALGLEADRKQVVVDSTKVSFFIGRNTLKPSKGEGMRSEEHTSELQSLMRISYAVFCLNKKKCAQYIILHPEPNTNTDTRSHGHYH